MADIEHVIKVVDEAGKLLTFEIDGGYEEIIEYYANKVEITNEQLAKIPPEFWNPEPPDDYKASAGEPDEVADQGAEGETATLCRT